MRNVFVWLNGSCFSIPHTATPPNLIGHLNPLYPNRILQQCLEFLEVPRKKVNLSDILNNDKQLKK